jgi:hypothetical protein
MNWQLSSQILKEKCITRIIQGSQEQCTRLLRLRAVGATLFVELVGREPDSDEEFVKDLVHLPRETYLVSEPYFGELYVAYEGGKLIAASWDWSGLLRKLKARGYYVGRSNYLPASKIVIPYVEKTVSAGLSDSGEIVDPLGALDKTDYGAEPLKAAYEWIKSTYTGKNAEYAWYDIIVAITHVVTSPLMTPHYLKKHFLDYVVYNVVAVYDAMAYDYGVIMYVLEKLLGDPRGDYNTVIYGEPLKADLGSKRLAAMLLDLNRLPLVLMGQTKKTLKFFKYVLETAGGEYIILDRRGEKRIPNLRGLIIFADDLYDIPARSLVLRWNLTSTRSPPAELPPIKPIYGFAARLWKKYRNNFAGVNWLPHLVEAVAGVVAQEIRGEAEEVATFTEHVATSLTAELDT